MTSISPANDIVGGQPLPDTERRLADSRELDTMPTLELLQLMNREDARAIEIVAQVLPLVAELVEVAADRLARGGSIHYFGAGTSGRLGVLDAAELLPTFNLALGIVEAHIAGGNSAMFTSVEGSEDSDSDGRRDASGLGENDVAIGLTVAGAAPYVGGALEEARARGAHTALVTSNAASPLADLADNFIAVPTGAEVLTGSTRLKAGTAEKVILNGFSTALMVRSGRTWSNLMVSVVASNAKLRRRTLLILAEATGASAEECEVMLREASGDLKVAIVAALADTSVEAARDALSSSSGNVRTALATIDGRQA